MPTHTPKISVITICLNDLVGLKKTVESVLAQDYPSLEYIVIDGGSKDGCKEYLETIKGALYYFVSEPDSGIYNAQNKGAKKSSGQYCIFLNAGDYFYNSTVMSQLVKNGLNKDIIYGNMLIDNGKGQLKQGTMPEKLTLDFMILHTLWHPVTLIRRELFEKYGFYREDLKIVSDYDFFLRTISIHRVSSQHVPIHVCVFNTEGIGSNPKHASLHHEERKKVQLQYFPLSAIELAFEYNKLANMKTVKIALSIKTKIIDRLRNISSWK